jgi:hypothetical protein
MAQFITYTFSECFAEMTFQEITQRGHCKIASPNSPYITNKIIHYGEKIVQVYVECTDVAAYFQVLQCPPLQTW